ETILSRTRLRRVRLNRGAARRGGLDSLSLSPPHAVDVEAGALDVGAAVGQEEAPLADALVARELAGALQAAVGPERAARALAQPMAPDRLLHEPAAGIPGLPDALPHLADEVAGRKAALRPEPDAAASVDAVALRGDPQRRAVVGPSGLVRRARGERGGERQRNSPSACSPHRSTSS